MTIFSGDELYGDEITSGPIEDELPWDDGYDDDAGGWLDRNPDPGPPPVVDVEPDPELL